MGVRRPRGTRRAAQRRRGGMQVGDRTRFHLGGERDRLAQRRMRVDRERDVLGVGAHLERVDGLGDQVAGADADDAGAEQPP